MTDDTLGAVDPVLVARWLEGWTRSRETPPPVADHGGLRVDVGLPEQRVRYVFTELGPAIPALAATIHEPYMFLKACASPEAMRAILPPPWSVQPPGYLMTCDGPMTGVMAEVGGLPAGYRLEVNTGAKASSVRVVAEDGSLAASGWVVPVDEFAIYDRIETDPAHRRRGLGRAVMKALEGLAREAGATRGLLVATDDGRALYETVGWSLHTLFCTAEIPPPVPAV
ncbi:GNAT family N-acetyltransferase [Kordiimonas marina]|uniref:GNAT family N-acetyltransferase n=1 Tax=Kordiimonas marina TaxID=2872312 RepID=UPI001FF5E043|nr:GNAT family N-acetyltransferase [Kordiimonas marina]MCJ9429159.1 GNAT family N-acetyltransferase [Kordiimonas marina]